MALNRHDLETHVIVIHHVTNLRGTVEKCEHEPADRIHLIVLKRNSERLPYLLKTHRTGDRQATFRVTAYVGPFRDAFFDIANYLFKYVFKGDYSRVPPCSSITTANCTRASRMDFSTVSSSAVSGT